MIRLIAAVAATGLLAASTGFAAESAPVKIPLAEGLVEVAAVQRPSGDEEQITVVTAATTAAVDFATEFRLTVDGKPASFVRTRRVRREDLAASNRRNLVYQDGDAPMFPGSTTMQFSAASLAELKAKGSVAAVLGTLPDSAYTADATPFSLVATGRKYFRGKYTRIGTAPEGLSVVINGVPTMLPVIHARGTLTVGSDSIDSEVWVLDDAANPMVLKARQGKHSSGQTVRIDFRRQQPPVAILQKALSDGSCRAALNGIYFDFGKASLLPQSAPALASVAQLMKNNPTWTLRIEGHTDSVGGAAFNLDLSQRRAAAVRDALAKQFALAGNRLVASGFGLTRPVAANTTLEGRAANRRVELARTCP